MQKYVDDGKCIHEGADNIDINCETIDGKNTFHAMARVVFQQQQKREGKQKVIKRGTSKSLHLTPEIESLMNCKPFTKPVQRSEPSKFNDPTSMIANCKLKGELGVRDLSWIFLRMIHREVFPISRESTSSGTQLVPFWTGFNSQLAQQKEIFTAAVYPPIINAKPTDMATVYTAMLHCKNMSHHNGQNYSIQTMDQQLFAIAMQIKWSKPDVFATHIIRLGGFHTLASFLGAIGKLWGDGGLRDLLADSSVYAANTVDNMLLGKQFHRAVRGITLSYETLFHALITSFLDWRTDNNKNISCEFWEAVLKTHKQIQENHEEKIEAVKQLDTLIEKELLLHLKEYREWGRTKSATFKYWDMFLDAAELVLLDIRAARDGLWRLHMHAGASMIPYFFSTDKTNYARWMPVYILEMVNSPAEVISVFEEGQFSVYEVPGAFNGVWSDMGTEKTIIKHAKGEGGIVGFTRKSPALVRWILTRHVMAQYANAMKKRARIETSEFRTHQQCNPASMKKDEEDVTRLLKHLNENMTNPFDIKADENPDVLVNISSGLHASKEVKETLLNAVNIGERKMTQFVKSSMSVDSSSSFYQPIKRASVKTFSSMNKRTRIQSEGKSKEVHISAEMVFRRALTISKSRVDVTLETIVSHPITAIPTSLFHEDGTMRKTTKSEMGRKIEELTEAHTRITRYEGPSTYIRDSMAIIQMMPGNNYNTFDHLAAAYLQGLMQSFDITGADTVVDVFDQYKTQDSVKAGERENRSRAAGTVKQYSVRSGRPVPVWKKFLSSNNNKHSLIEFLCSYIANQAPQQLSSGKQLILAGGFEDGCGTKRITTEGKCFIKCVTHYV